MGYLIKRTFSSVLEGKTHDHILFGQNPIRNAFSLAIHMERKGGDYMTLKNVFSFVFRDVKFDEKELPLKLCLHKKNMSNLCLHMYVDLTNDAFSI